ncbi:hypothetical protein RIF25_05930 [Thermosynechococcaceae cyanobacterium BACA0444]|uniref:Uncharacterized protein n=1 Tax=Pseudocalidococcus azoricus BACA0444 TaxID=2918990 RepID=A0AAE4FQG2_9CYAN|nr:hypothetical protein [Pseudocalidococcus azoricus]MDS3860343.1 hypothetical protein [Pseudocalidococcus azoricus BACA0444]
MAILKKLFSALFGFLGGLLGLGKKSGYYLELDEAKSVPKAPAPVAETPASEAPVSTPARVAKVESPVPNPLNLPAPTVTTSPEPLTAAPETPAIPFVQFARRRPGANMKSFLELAKQVKTSA